MESFTGRATTSGNSKALSFEKALFSAHPEFASGTVAASVLGPGVMLVTANAPVAGGGTVERDPVLDAYLAFIEAQIVQNPQHLRAWTTADLSEVDDLVDGVTVDEDEDLGDFELP